MNKYTEKQSDSHKTFCEQPVDLRERSTGNLLEASFQLKMNFSKATNDFARVKEEMENEILTLQDKLDEKQENGKKYFKHIDDSYLQNKDLQIDRLITFYNNTERIINTFDTLFSFLKLQNTILEDALDGKIMKDEDFRKKFLNLNY